MEIRSVVDWYTSIPLDTPLAGLVAADPGNEMIERDLEPLHKSERLNCKSAPKHDPCNAKRIEELSCRSASGATPINSPPR
jgi:hypothetical protein